MTTSKQLIEDISCIIQNYDFDEEARINFNSCMNKVIKHFELLEFQVDRLTRDKSIMHNLLTKTSAELNESLENSVKESREMVQILNSTPAMIYVKNEELDIKLVNKEFGNYFQINDLNDLNEVEQSIVNNVDFFEKLHNYERLILKNSIDEKDLQFQHNDHFLKVNLSIIKNIDGRPLGLVGVIWKITELIQKEKELEVKVLEANEANKAKDQFLANISHEIRTPMNAIIGMSELLLLKESDSETYNTIQKIYSSSNNLLHIINDILDFSKLESGKFTIEKENFLFEKLIENVITNCISRLENKSLDVFVDIEKDVPFALNGGYKRLIQVLTNLLANAIKFTESGKIELIVESSKIYNNEVELKFKIIDTGIGMSEDQLELLFKPFSQIDFSNTRKY